MTESEMTYVMLAYKDGKRIEYSKKRNPVKVWFSIDEPNWNWAMYDYRIAEEDDCRYGGADDFMKAFGRHGPWIKDKKSGTLKYPLEASKEGVRFVDGQCHPYSDLYKNFVWVDGCVCGKR